MEYIIRPIGPQDAEGIAALRRMPGVMENTLGLPSCRVADSRAFIEGLGPNDHNFVAAAEDETVIGAAGLCVCSNPRMRHVGSVGIFVHTDWQGRGVGTALMETLLDLADNWLMLVRVELGSSRGVMAICKDTSRLSLCAASTLPATGQTAGKICDDNDGILAINGSAFLDDGTSNGGQISGLAICEGSEMGYRLGGVGDKRLELRDDNRMYIVDSYAAVGDGTRDACEFRPALIVDGENLSRNSTWTSPNPRAVLGQSDRLETMMVVVEGRLLDSPGCSVVDIADKMEEYGCVQALNLDGGTSAIMYYKGEYITRCSNTALPGGRTLPSAWVYR